MEMKRLQDVNNQRLAMLRTRSKDAYNAVLWLRENGHIFSGTVHEPIMMLIALLSFFYQVSKWK